MEKIRNSGENSPQIVHRGGHSEPPGDHRFTQPIHDPHRVSRCQTSRKSILENCMPKSLDRCFCVQSSACGDSNRCPTPGSLSKCPAVGPRSQSGIWTRESACHQPFLTWNALGASLSHSHVPAQTLKVPEHSSRWALPALWCPPVAMPANNNSEPFLLSPEQITTAALNLSS